jgi:hypothetical protein
MNSRHDLGRAQEFEHLFSLLIEPVHPAVVAVGADTPDDNIEIVAFPSIEGLSSPFAPCSRVREAFGTWREPLDPCTAIDVFSR